MEDLYKRSASLERKLQRIGSDPKLTPRNRKVILEFHHSLVAEGIGIARQLRYLDSLHNFGIWLGKDFDKTTVKDILRVQAENIEGSGYEEWTKSTYRKIIRRFFTTLDPEKYRDITAKINGGAPKKHQEKKWVLITEEDAKKMIESADKVRDAALLAVMWESGARIAEILTLQIQDIVPLEEGAVRVSFRGKTGVRLNKLWLASPYLRDWLRQHPFKGRSDAIVWISEQQQNRREPLSYNGAVKIIRKVAELAKIEGKDINPHGWRHARATYLASNGWSEQQLCKFLGWEFGSDMPRIYIDRAGVNVDNAVDSLYGVLHKEDELPKNVPLQCIRCKEPNTPGSQFCVKCGMPMTQEAAMLEKESKETAQEILMRRLEKLEAMVKAKR